MKYYAAGALSCKQIENINIPKEDLGFLYSYLELRNKEKLVTTRDVLLDSGAYSVMSKGIAINIENYIEYVKNNKDSVKLYANLDVIGDSEQTEINQKIMEDAGLNPLPTFHYGSEYKVLEKLLEKYDYIGLGGLVPIITQTNVLVKHLDKCFELIHKNKKNERIVKIHGWGCVGGKTIYRYPFYSIDSTAWLVGVKHKKQMSYINGRISTGRTVISRYANPNTTNLLNVESTVKLVKQATEIWAKRGIKWG
jgi:hypothetical protein